MNILSMAADWTNRFGTLQEKLFLGTSIALVGFLIVLILLTAIIFSILIMSGLISLSDKRKIRKKDSKTELPVLENIKAAETSGTYKDDHEDIVAVITAAVCAYMSSANVRPGAPFPGFRVKNIRRL